MYSTVSNVETKGEPLFWYLFLGPNRKPAALLVVFYSSSTTDQLQTVSSYLDSGKLIFDEGKLISIVSKQRICSKMVCFFFSPGLLSFFSTNHPNKLTSIQAGRSAFCSACPSGRHYSAQPFFTLCSETSLCSAQLKSSQDTDGPGGVSLPKYISGRERRSS